MALLITPHLPPFLTTCRLPVNQAYVRIARLDYDKDAATVTLFLEYFASEAAAKSQPRAESFTIPHMPREVVCPNPLEILAAAEGVPAAAVAYQKAAEALRVFFGESATIISVL